MGFPWDLESEVDNSTIQIYNSTYDSENNASKYEAYFYRPIDPLPILLNATLVPNSTDLTLVKNEVHCAALCLENCAEGSLLNHQEEQNPPCVYIELRCITSKRCIWMSCTLKMSMKVL